MPSEKREWNTREAIRQFLYRNDDVVAAYRRLGYSHSLHDAVEGVAEKLLSVGAERPQPDSILALLSEAEKQAKHGLYIAKEPWEAVVAEIQRITADGNAGEDVSFALRSLVRELRRAAAGDWDTQARVEQFDNLLRDLLYADQHYRAKDAESFKQDIIDAADRYLANPFMHCPTLTIRLTRDLLDTELVPLAKEATATHDPAAVWSSLDHPWGTIVPAMLHLIFLAALLAAIGFFYVTDFLWAAALIAAYLMWHQVSRYRRLRQVRLARQRLLRFTGGLQVIRDEVANGHFVPNVIARRLRRLERKGLYVHSLAYPLLKQLTTGSLARKPDAKNGDEED